MKTLIIGAGHLLAPALVDRLVARGEHDFRVFVSPGPRLARLESLARRNPEVRMELLSMSAFSPGTARRALEGTRAVYHLPPAHHRPGCELSVEAELAARVLAAALGEVPASSCPRVVILSSLGVYAAARVPRGAIDEETPLEPHPGRREAYAQAMLRHERLFREVAERRRLPLVVLRLGIVYGPGFVPVATGGHDLGALVPSFGREPVLPLTFVENGADAVALAGAVEEAVGRTFNVVDDELPTASEYLRLYRRHVKRALARRLPYLAALAVSSAVQRDPEWPGWPRGSLPPRGVLGFGRLRFENAALKLLGWRQGVPTREGLQRAFDSLTRSDWAPEAPAPTPVPRSAASP